MRYFFIINVVLIFLSNGCTTTIGGFLYLKGEILDSVKYVECKTMIYEHSGTGERQYRSRCFPEKKMTSYELMLWDKIKHLVKKDEKELMSLPTGSCVIPVGE